MDPHHLPSCRPHGAPPLFSELHEGIGLADPLSLYPVLNTPAVLNPTVPFFPHPPAVDSFPAVRVYPNEYPFEGSSPSCPFLPPIDIFLIPNENPSQEPYFCDSKPGEARQIVPTSLPATPFAATSPTISQPVVQESRKRKKSNAEHCDDYRKKKKSLKKVLDEDKIPELQERLGWLLPHDLQSFATSFAHRLYAPSLEQVAHELECAVVKNAPQCKQTRLREKVGDLSTMLHHAVLAELVTHAAPCNFCTMELCPAAPSMAALLANAFDGLLASPDISPKTRAEWRALYEALPPRPSTCGF